MLVAWPYALVNPLTGLPKALRYFERFPTPFPVLFDGNLERATSLPREYLPVLLGLTLPEPVLLLLAAGAGLAIAALLRRRRRADPASVAVGVVVLAAAFPVLYAVARRTPMYNGVRHTLFILSPVACLAALAADALMVRLRPVGRAVLTALLVLAAARQAVRTARLFPYEYASFNSFAGGLPGATSNTGGRRSRKRRADWRIGRQRHRVGASGSGCAATGAERPKLWAPDSRKRRPADRPTSTWASPPPGPAAPRLPPVPDCPRSRGPA
jgi:hypothetical protein